MNDRTKQEIGAALEGLDAFRKRTERAIAQQIERASIVDTWPLEVVRANAIATSKILAACLLSPASPKRSRTGLPARASVQSARRERPSGFGGHVEPDDDQDDDFGRA